MTFFKQIRVYIIIFILFGLFTTFQNDKYKLLLRVHSVFSILIWFCIFSFAVYSNKFYAFTTISNTVANLMYLMISFTHLIIIIESILYSKAQLRTIHKLSRIDQLFKSKLKINVPYKEEKRKIFIRNVIVLSILAGMKGFLALYLFYHNRWYCFIWISLYSQLILYLRFLQILFFLWLMETRLNVINYELKSIQRHQNAPAENIGC